RDFIAAGIIFISNLGIAVLAQGRLLVGVYPHLLNKPAALIKFLAPSVTIFDGDGLSIDIEEEKSGAVAARIIGPLGLGESSHRHRRFSGGPQERLLDQISAVIIGGKRDRPSVLVQRRFSIQPKQRLLHFVAALVITTPNARIAILVQCWGAVRRAIGNFD